MLCYAMLRYGMQCYIMLLAEDVLFSILILQICQSVILSFSLCNIAPFLIHPAGLHDGGPELSF